MLDAHKVAQRASNFQTFKTDVRHANITLQEPCFQGICFLIISLSSGCKGLGLAWVAVAEKQFFKLYFFSALFFETQTSPALQENSFSGSKKLVFPHCSFETQRSSALQQNNFSGSNFFFSALFFETQTSPALQENNFSGSIFLSTRLF